MIVDGFPESHPQIQNAQSAGQPAHETAGNEVAQIGRGQQERIIGPPGGPREDDQQYTKGGTHGNEQQGPNPQKPYFGISGAATCSPLPRPVNRIARNQGSLSGCRRRRDSRLSAQSILPPHGRQSAVRFRPIRLFYGLRALMRSATSR